MSDTPEVEKTYLENTLSTPLKNPLIYEIRQAFVTDADFHLSVFCGIKQ